MKIDALEAEFLKAIEANPTDKVTRLIYADWLEEVADRPEEGKFVRDWTRDDYDEAIGWMSNFAAVMGREDGDDQDAIHVDDLIKAGWRHVKDGSQSCLVCSGFWAEEQMEYEADRNKFWWCWSTITGKPFTPDSTGKSRDGHLFCCCG